MSSISNAKVYLDIINERSRQKAQWGDQTHLPDVQGTPRFMVGITADWARYVNAQRVKKGGLAWDWILLEEVVEAFEAETTEHLREELVQCAAVCISWIEAIDSRAAGSPPAIQADDPFATS